MLLAILAARSGDVAAAEDALADAFAAALVQWPRDRAPAIQTGQLLTVARRSIGHVHGRRPTAAAAVERMSPGLAEYKLSVHMNVPVIDMTRTDIFDPHTPTGAHAIFKVTGLRIGDLLITLHKLV